MRPVCIEVKLEAPNLGNVLFLTPPSTRVDGIHSEEEIVPPGVQVAEPGLIAVAGNASSFYDPLENRRTLSGPARDGENGDVVDRPRRARGRRQRMKPVRA